MINPDRKPNLPESREPQPPHGRPVSASEFSRFEKAFPGSQQSDIVIFEDSFQLDPVVTVGDVIFDAFRSWSDYHHDCDIHRKIRLTIQRVKEMGIEVDGQTYPVVKIIQTMQNPKYDNSPFILVAQITRIIKMAH
jgi:hypothetical protein